MNIKPHNESFFKIGDLARWIDPVQRRTDDYSILLVVSTDYMNCHVMWPDGSIRLTSQSALTKIKY